MKKAWDFSDIDESHPVTPADPDAEPEIDEAVLNPKVGLALAAVRRAVSTLVHEEGVTPAEVTAAIGALVDMAVEDPVFTRYHLPSLLAPAWDPRDEWDPATDGTPPDSEGPVFYEGEPKIENPGVLPMRDNERGLPLIVSGTVRSTNGEPLAGAELHIWLAAASGHYSNTGVRGLPDWTLRAVQLTDEEGRYEFRSIKPVPYDFPVRPRIADEMLAAQGFSRYRPRHIHMKIRHPALLQEFTTQVYFRGDPYLGRYPATPGLRAAAELLQVDVEMHESDTGPYGTCTFNVVLPVRDDLADKADSPSEKVGAAASYETFAK
jgi:catechol 1,2-dioxygenase